MIDHAQARRISSAALGKLPDLQGPTRKEHCLRRFVGTGEMVADPASLWPANRFGDTSASADLWRALARTWDLSSPEEREDLARLSDYLISREQRGMVGRVTGWPDL